MFLRLMRWAALLFALLAPTLAGACVCGSMATQGPCATKLTDNGPLFVGTVISVTDEPKYSEVHIPRRWVRFHVDEAFVGVDGSEIELLTDTSDCGFGGTVGEQYLVQAYRPAGGGIASISPCNLTQRIGGAHAVVQFLRALRDGRKTPSLYGYVHKEEREVLAGYDKDKGPVAGVNIQISEVERSYETTTNDDGTYSFYDLPAGKYSVSMDLPKGLAVGRYVFEEGWLPGVELVAKGCREADWTVLPTARIHGRILEDNGKPANSVGVYLLPAGSTLRDRQGTWASMGDNGEYAIPHVSPGDYELVINPGGKLDASSPYPTVFFPGVTERGQGQILHVALGEDVRADIHLPKLLPTRRIRVRVLWSDGRPDPDALLHLENTMNPNREGSTYSGADAWWNVDLFRGETYTISAEVVCHVVKTVDGVLGSWPGVEFHSPTYTLNDDFASEELTLTVPASGCPEEPSEH